MGTHGAFRVRLSILLGALMLISTVAMAADEHPASGHITGDPSAVYGTSGYGLSSGYSTGDMTFGGEYPAVSELAPPERYMLAGTLGYFDGGGNHLPALITSVEDFCLDHHALYGSLPTTITVDGVSGLRGSASAPAEQALAINPITGEVPRLDAAQFSPGDFYVRELSNVEMRSFTERNLELHDLWIEGKIIDTASGRVGSVQLTSPVLYVRAYGLYGVIYENFAYRMSEPDYSTPVVTARILPPQESNAGDVWETDSSCAPSG